MAKANAKASNLHLRTLSKKLLNTDAAGKKLQKKNVNTR